MRTVVMEKTLYQFDELAGRAKENARDYFRQQPDLWGWADDWWASAKAFSDIAPIKISDADFERGLVTCYWTGDCDAEELSGLRAWKWLENNGWFKWAAEEAQGKCSLTGYCADCDFADPLVEYSRKPLLVPDLKQVFYECAQSWLYAGRRDFEYAYSDEAIDELVEANEYEFSKEGVLQ